MVGQTVVVVVGALPQYFVEGIEEFRRKEEPGEEEVGRSRRSF